MSMWITTIKCEPFYLKKANNNFHRKKAQINEYLIEI